MGLATLGAAERVNARAAGQSSHERLPHVPDLEGARNFRDLGGYRGAGGKLVRSGVLYRSGSMHGLTERDFARLRNIGIKRVIDFRANAERQAEPFAWSGPRPPIVLSKNYDMTSNPVMLAFSKPNLSAADVRAGMVEGYRVLPFMLADQYRTLFSEMKAGHTPLVFNCSAGKDRTGIAAALVLTALGVAREDVVADFLASNRYAHAGALGKSAAVPSALARLPADVAGALNGVDRSYIEAAFTAIEQRPGGLRAYYRDQLGVTPHDMRLLRARYLR